MDLSDRELVQKCQAGEMNAFQDLVSRYHQKVYMVILGLLRNREDALEVAQETFFRALRKINSFQGDSSLYTWIYRIAVNLCKNRVKYLKRRKTEAQDEYEALAERSPMTAGSGMTSGDIARPDHMVEGMQLERVVQICIVELDPDFREVLILRDVEDLSYEELCEVTGLPDGTVKSRLHRARAMLKQAVERKMGERAR